MTQDLGAARIWLARALAETLTPAENKLWDAMDAIVTYLEQQSATAQMTVSQEPVNETRWERGTTLTDAPPCDHKNRLVSAGQTRTPYEWCSDCGAFSDLQHGWKHPSMPVKGA